MYNYHKVLSHLEQLDIQYGESHRGTCPSCNRSGTFTATFNEEGLVYNCYSLSCKASGKVRKALSPDLIMDKLRKIRGEVQETRTARGLAPIGHDFEIPDRVVPLPKARGTESPHLASRAKQFMLYWDIQPDLDIYYDIKDDRVVFPVYGVDAYRSTILDMVGRSLDKNAKPKWLRYGNTSQPFVYGPRGNKTCIVVEDVISAIKCYELTGIAGVALLGTQLTDEHRDFITMEFASAIVALDRDALDKQLSISKELSPYMTSVRVCRLFDDIKYGNEEDVLELERLQRDILNEKKREAQRWS